MSAVSAPVPDQIRPSQTVTTDRPGQRARTGIKLRAARAVCSVPPLHRHLCQHAARDGETVATCPMAQDAAKVLILQAAQVPLRRTYSPHPHVADGPLSARQANLESVVGQLDAKTNEVTAATQEAATQKAFVQQITKKLDVLSKRCKTLEQENTRMCEAQVGMVETEVQTEPDAVLLRAQADTAAVQESLRDAKADWEAMAASLQARAAQEAAGQLAALEVANEACGALEAQLHEANERAASTASESAAQLAAEAAHVADQATTTQLEPQHPRPTHKHKRCPVFGHASLFWHRSPPASWLGARPAPACT